MDIFLQQLINGITIGSLYSLVALGYTMVFGILKLVNFAHGDLITLSAYLNLLFLSLFFNSFSFVSFYYVILSFLLTILVVSLFGVLLEKIAYKPLRNASRLSAVVSALGVSFFIQNLVMLIWGPNIKVYPENLFPNNIIYLSGAVINIFEIVIICVSAFFMILLFLFIHKTKIGMAIRAVAIDFNVAEIVGINTNRIISLVFIIGSALAAVTGVFIAFYYRGITFNMGWGYGLNAFIAAVLGGIGNIPGAVLGGYVLGIFNVMILGYVSSVWADFFTFLLLIVLLIFKPYGLLGEKQFAKL